MAAEESRKRIRVSQQSIVTLAKQIDDRDRDAAPHTTYQGPVRKLSEKWLRSAENDTRKIWRIHKAFLAEKENLPLGSEEQDAWVDAIMEEQAARSARSRRKALEDFHWVCGW